MKEYDLFMPLSFNDGSAVPEEVLDEVRRRLVEWFGGLTDMKQRNEGYWTLGHATFRDEIVIYRALSSRKGSRKFLRRLKRDLMERLRQTDFLIVERAVKTV